MMKDQEHQNPNRIGSAPGSTPPPPPPVPPIGPGGEKRCKTKPPDVPPRRNVPPPPVPDTARDKIGNPDAPRVYPQRQTGSILIKKEQRPAFCFVGKDGGSAAGAPDSPPITEFCPRPASSSANSNASSTPLPPEGGEANASGKGRGHKEAPLPPPSRPCVTFDPNPTILLTGSDGSPMKLSGKDGHQRKFPTGVENSQAFANKAKKFHANPPSSSPENEDLEAAARKKPEEPEDCHLSELYTQINEVVAAKPDEIENANEDETEDPSAVPMIWISKWVDYSDKYGLGYQLSDDSIGVLFNDFTKLLLLPDGDNIHYIERNGQEHYHRLGSSPEALYKKVTLLRYFRNYMNEHLLKAGATMSPRDGDELSRIPSLKTYFRTRSAIILHLTNGTLQINFFDDHTKIILCPLMGAVTYIDKKRNFRTFRLEMLTKFGCSTDLANRLRYGCNMIQKLMLTKSGSSSKGSSGVETLSAPQQPTQVNKIV